MSTQHHMNLTDTFPISGLTVEIRQTVYGYEHCDKFPLEGRPQHLPLPQPAVRRRWLRSRGFDPEHEVE
jgi:hypothetical protein